MSPPTTQPILHTERLRLVPLSDEHREFECELDSDPEVMRYIIGRPSTPDEAEQSHWRRIEAAQEQPGLGFWAGYAGEEVVGWWILRPPHGPDQPKLPGQAELGYRLLRRHWRRGYASEGSRELIRYGFLDVGLDRILAQTMAVNLASQATMRSAGMSFARSFISAGPPEDGIPGGEHGEVEYEITRQAWESARGGPAGEPA